MLQHGAFEAQTYVLQVVNIPEVEVTAMERLRVRMALKWTIPSRSTAASRMPPSPVICTVLGGAATRVAGKRSRIQLTVRRFAQFLFSWHVAEVSVISAAVGRGQTQSGWTEAEGMIRSGFLLDHLYLTPYNNGQ